MPRGREKDFFPYFLCSKVDDDGGNGLMPPICLKLKILD